MKLGDYPIENKDNSINHTVITSTSSNIYNNTSTSRISHVLFSAISAPDKEKILSVAKNYQLSFDVITQVLDSILIRSQSYPDKIQNLTAYTINTLKKAAKGEFNSYSKNIKKQKSITGSLPAPLQPKLVQENSHQPPVKPIDKAQRSVLIQNMREKLKTIISQTKQMM